MGYEDDIVNKTDYLHNLFNSFSNIGVSRLIVDEFALVNDGKDSSNPMALTHFHVINEMFHCLAQNDYSISSLSIKHDDISIADNDEEILFVESIHNIKLKEISMPHINNQDVLNKLLVNLKGCHLESIELSNDIGTEEMHTLTQSCKGKKVRIPHIKTKNWNAIQTKELTDDLKLNKYANAIAYNQLVV